jgi:PTS system ascorbate-specific IIB component
MLKVLAACGNGMGSSTMIKIRIEQVLKELNLEFKVDHSSVGEAKGRAKDYDLILVGMPFVKDFSFVNAKTKVIGLVNLMSAVEIKGKVTEALGL